MNHELNKLTRKYNPRAQVLKQKKDLMVLRQRFQKSRKHILDPSFTPLDSLLHNQISLDDSMSPMPATEPKQTSPTKPGQKFYQEHRFLLKNCKVFDTQRLRSAFEAIEQYKKTQGTKTNRNDKLIKVPTQNRMYPVSTSLSGNYSKATLPEQYHHNSVNTMTPVPKYDKSKSRSHSVAIQKKTRAKALSDIILRLP